MTSAPARLVLALVVFVTCSLCRAQQFVATLPDAPSALQEPVPAKAQEGSASISGVVLDIEEATVPHATITVTETNGFKRELVSEADGTFAITGLPAGDFKVLIVAKGLETLEFPDIHLTAGQHHALPRIAMPLLVSTSVNVIATPDEIANEQVREEEHQRVLGIFPNFYTSYLWDAAPLKAHHKFSLAIRSLIDPVAFATAGIVAGVEQAHNTFPGYGDDAAGFGKRYGAVIADHVTNRILGGAVFPTLFHQDPRYFYQGSGTVKSRALYAMSSSFICRGDNGHRQLNYSVILGSFAAAGISTLYRSTGDRTVGLAMRSAAIGFGTRMGANVAREFLFRKIVTHVPKYAHGKAPIENKE